MCPTPFLSTPMANLLIIERDKRIARMLKKELRSTFSNVQVCEHLHNSLHVALSDIPDIILYDIDGEPNALELCAALRKKNPLVRAG